MKEYAQDWRYVRRSWVLGPGGVKWKVDECVIVGELASDLSVDCIICTPQHDSSFELFIPTVPRERVRPSIAPRSDGRHCECPEATCAGKTQLAISLAITITRYPS